MIQSREAVLKAIDEFDRLGREAFLKKYGFGKARSYMLLHDGKHYDSKAIIGAAYGYENPTVGPMSSADFVGGAATVQRWLEDLGFVLDVGESGPTSARVTDRSKRSTSSTSIPQSGTPATSQLAKVEETCAKLHKLLWQLPRLSFPIDFSSIPRNGIYVLFEKGESGHGGDRIVRIGTHNGDNQLRSRIKQHFLSSNKDRSIFRKNIGRCLLNQVGDPFLANWEFDLTTRVAKEKYGSQIDFEKQASVEQRVSEYMREAFSFVVFEVPLKEERLLFESRLVSTVSLCSCCRPSDSWLGSHSPKEPIRRSGLWQVNELFKTPLSGEVWNNFSNALVAEFGL